MKNTYSKRMYCDYCHSYVVGLICEQAFSEWVVFGTTFNFWVCCRHAIRWRPVTAWLMRPYLNAATDEDAGNVTVLATQATACRLQWKKILLHDPPSSAAAKAMLTPWRLTRNWNAIIAQTTQLLLLFCAIFVLLYFKCQFTLTNVSTKFLGWEKSTIKIDGLLLNSLLDFFMSYVCVLFNVIKIT